MDSLNYHNEGKANGESTKHGDEARDAMYPLGHLPKSTRYKAHDSSWVAPRRPSFFLDVSSRTLGRVVCDPELKVSRGWVPIDKKTSEIW